MWLADLAAGGPASRCRRSSPRSPPGPAASPAAKRPATRSPAPGSARRRAQWLVVRGTTIGDEAGGQTAVMIEPPRPHELAPLAAEAYELTERERAVTELVAQGLATTATADRLSISAWTVQDHLKSIFEKVDVGTRGELIARVFFDPDVPGLTDAHWVGAPRGCSVHERVVMTVNPTPARQGERRNSNGTTRDQVIHRHIQGDSQGPGEEHEGDRPQAAVHEGHRPQAARPRRPPPASARPRRRPRSAPASSRAPASPMSPRRSSRRPRRRFWPAARPSRGWR